MARPPIEQKEVSGATVPDSYLEYAHRGYGMDHDRYDWSLLVRRKPVAWPNKARVALWVNVAFEFFPLDTPAKPFKALGGMVTSYPDLRHYSLRDYGNRVGIFRVMDALDAAGIDKVTASFNSKVAQRYPYLIDQVNERGWEVMANGVDMAKLHYSGLAADQEKAQVKESLSVLREMSGQPVKGWLSPARSESFDTPDYIAAEGVEYFCDWINDDMPYPFRTKSGEIVAMPHQHWIDDSVVWLHYKHQEQDFVDQVKDQFDLMYDEAGREGGRIMAITIHPWMSGQPHRIKYLEEALNYVGKHAGVWNATGYDIMQEWKKQQ
jgi:allantoinase